MDGGDRRGTRASSPFPAAAAEVQLLIGEGSSWRALIEIEVHVALFLSPQRRCSLTGAARSGDFPCPCCRLTPRMCRLCEFELEALMSVGFH